MSYVQRVSTYACIWHPLPLEIHDYSYSSGPSLDENDEPTSNGSWFAGYKPDEDWKSKWEECPEWATQVNLTKYKAAYGNVTTTEAPAEDTTAAP